MLKRTMVVGFPLDGSCVLITKGNQAVTPSFRDDTCRHRAGKDKKFHPDKSGPERGGRRLTALWHSMEPREKATSNALLFADLAPRKTAVCLSPPDRAEGGLDPASQAACHQARRRDTGPAWDNLQATSLADWLLAWLSAKAHAPTPWHVFLVQGIGEMCGICNLQASGSVPGWGQWGLGIWQAPVSNWDGENHLLLI